MTINDIMLRDMAEAERRQRREEEMREDDREIGRRLWRRRLRAAGEALRAEMEAQGE